MDQKLKRPLSIIIFICLNILFSRCQKEDDNVELSNTNIPSIASAKKWVENNNLNLEILKYTKKIDWDNAIITNGEKGKTIEVPIVVMDNTSTNVVEDKDYKTHMRLLFLTDTENRYKVYNIVYTTKNEVFDNNNKEQNFYHIDKQYSGYITIQDNNNKIIYSGEYKDGTQIGLHNASVGSKETSKYICKYWVYVGPTVTCSRWEWVPEPGGLSFGGPPGISGPLIFPDFQSNQIDPCIAAEKLTTDSKSDAYLSAKNNILSANPELEHSITLGKEVSKSTIQGPPKGGGGPIGSPSTTTITQAPMNTGGTNGVKVNQNWPGAFGAMHNHPNNSPLSSGDIYAAVTLNINNSDFTTSFIFTAGETYAIVVTDLAAAKAFVATYPADISPIYPPEFPQAIFNQIQEVKTKFGESNEARTKAIALVLDYNNAGITLMKQDSNGKFNRIKIEQTTNSEGSVTFLPVPCN
ncbi:hypothetical protein Flavo103_10600 [Flavobacterium collinsii]|uniref:hypothetical protein n=1 Tax=Flavobacterium collinsii TaxID=1114861 RepID=UPI0022C961E1|nr:hypothetical protein [Flavobacterium collinsii]GIQ57924.1 hypothetical protein Flavo103_10600 [Flavobacterium collinsii]